MIPKNVQMPNPNPKYKPPGTAAGGRGGNAMKYDNCKDCVARCVHAGKDREFICRNGVSCKVTKKPIATNADKIRAMSDEELAKYLSNPCDCAVDPERDGYRECGNDLCVKYLLEWLQQPAEEEKL